MVSKRKTKEKEVDSIIVESSTVVSSDIVSGDIVSSDIVSSDIVSSDIVSSDIESTIVVKPKTIRKKKEKNVVVEEEAAKDIEAKDIEAKDIEAKDIEAKHGHDDDDDDEDKDDSKPVDGNKKQEKPRKRGRKPKGGKIVVTTPSHNDVIVSEPNIILHLKCKKQDLEIQNDFLTIKYSPTIQNVENYQFDKNKGSELNFFIISDKNDSKQLPLSLSSSSSLSSPPPTTQQTTTSDATEYTTCENKSIWKKLQKLAINLHNNNIIDKKSACFWCTCDFDNPPIYIPKYELNDTYHCYGCFCSPECATASLFKEPIDTSTKFERYHLINHIYCKIYNYNKNVKPAPDPYYTLNKYYGNLTIQEYRKLLKNDRLILIVDKPFTRSLPELHEDNDDFILNNKTIPNTMNKYKMKQKPLKSTLLSENFNMAVVK
jgi:hypothetical protein